MEKQSEGTKIALIQKDVENIKKSQERMEIKVDALQGIFWTTKGHEEFVADVNKRFASLENQRYFLPIAASILTGILEYLLISFLQHTH